LQPLRDGVYKFRKIVKEAGLVGTDSNKTKEISKETRAKLKHIDSLNVFFDVEVSNNILNPNGLAFQMLMKPSDPKKGGNKQQQINWESSKKLMFGSLVCFSSDLFKRECLIGIVCDRNEKDLKNGLISVKFDYQTDLNQNFDVQDEDFEFLNQNSPVYGKTYIMLETSAYFESYKHVLEALVSFKSSTSEQDFPFKKHIVDCQNQTIERPNYLNNVAFDFRLVLIFVNIVYLFFFDISFTNY
jgi:hypothetical protein